MLKARSRTSLLFALTLALASLAAPTARAGEAQDQFEKGNVAFEAEKYQDALDAYKAAWKLTKTHDLAYMMGRCETELGKLRDAAEHYTYALDHFPLTGDPELRANLETALADVKKSLAVVRVVSNTKDVVVTVDGVKVDPSTLETAMFFAPGKHVIEATAPGHRSVRRPFDFKGGEDEQVTMNLVPEGDTPRNPIPGYVMAGVGVVGVAIGAGLVGAAEGKKSEALKLSQDIGSVEGCQKDAAACQKLRDTTAATDAMGNGGVAALVFGGLFGAASVAYLLIPSRKSAPSKREPSRKKGTITALPVIGASTGGVILSGSF